VISAFRDAQGRTSGATPQERDFNRRLLGDGARKVLPVKRDCIVVLALGCIESTRLALKSFPTAPDRAATS